MGAALFLRAACKGVAVGKTRGFLLEPSGRAQIAKPLFSPSVASLRMRSVAWGEGVSGGGGTVGGHALDESRAQNHRAVQGKYGSHSRVF